MRNKLIMFLVALMLIVPIQTKALTRDYQDVISPIISTNSEEGKVTLYFF